MAPSKTAKAVSYTHLHQTSGVLSVFEDMNDGVGRPFAPVSYTHLFESSGQGGPMMK